MAPRNTEELEPMVVVERYRDTSGLRNLLSDEVVVVQDRSIVGELRAAMEERESVDTVVDLRSSKRGRRARRRRSNG